MVSEWLTTVGDWIVEHCAQLGITISIPILIAFICKLVLGLIKNKATIKNAVLSATNTVKDATSTISQMIDKFQTELEAKMAEFEDSVGVMIDEKFGDLKDQRVELYNSIIGGVEVIKTEANKHLDEINEIAEAVEEKTAEVEEKVAEIEQVKAEDILR